MRYRTVCLDRGWLRRVVGLFLAFGFVLAGQPDAAPAEETGAPPFRAGEELVYRLKWLFIPAGEAALRVLPVERTGGKPAYHFLLTARSNAFIDPFYMVRDTVNAWADMAVSHSLGYEKHQREGRTHREVAVAFHWDLKQVVYSNFGRSRLPLPIRPGTLDPLSALYYIRGRELGVGDIIEKPVTDGKKCVIGRARVVGRETIRVAGKRYDTFRIEPELEHVGGVFEKSPNARILLWITADRYRIPVRISSRVAVGSFTGELVSATGIGGGP